MVGIALTGGIGSGKSSVCERLIRLGAAVIDADQVAHEVQRPDGPAYEPMIVRFGEAIRAADGTIDRPRLAHIVFNDPEALADLNAITHPLIGLGMLARRAEHEGTDRVVVFAIPLLRPVHRDLLGFGAVVVVDCPIEIALDRLIEGRGMDPADAVARIAAQASREERVAGADFVIDNSSTLGRLDEQVARLWSWITERRDELSR